MRAYYPERPLAGGHFQWDNIRLTQPAWLVTIKGADLSKDGPVTVIFDRALEAERVRGLVEAVLGFAGPLVVQMRAISLRHFSRCSSVRMRKSTPALACGATVLTD